MVGEPQLRALMWSFLPHKHPNSPQVSAVDAASWPADGVVSFVSSTVEDDAGDEHGVRAAIRTATALWLVRPRHLGAGDAGAARKTSTTSPRLGERVDERKLNH
ncbi:hypothetical protein [Rhodococcus sp. LB1]|uniref:hypothetical protein n=1 Tax=Rhodococcus sp. LB1 TaxID=1807499 RepID=UPI000B20328A|nr:hypothetical protein [Rhodococcus sp. LB1]